MSQRKRRVPQVETKPPAISPEAPASKNWFVLQGVALGLIAFVFYVNTASNRYALDDPLVISENSYTMKGFSGIPGILTSDAFAGLPGVMGQLAGGRYRPLSPVTFAIEQGLFGTNLPVSHLVNVVLYCGVVVLLFLFFEKHLFKSKPGLAFIAGFIFAIHPVHTEAVANLKGRDELMSLLFLIVSVTLFCKGRTLWSLAAFFLALLSKESGITFLAIIPLTSYFFLETDWKTSLRRVVPYAILTAGYLLLRSSISGVASARSDEVLNAPFLFASSVEAFCTKVLVLGKYLLLLVFPYPLSYDYSYNQIPYAHPFELRFLVALIANVALVAAALLALPKRRLYSYGILFYFATISIVSNFVIDIGAPMGERFLFLPSVGFAIAAGSIAYRFASYRNVLLGIAAVLLGICGYETIMRNRDWKDNLTLFARDVQTVPNSAKAHDNLAVALIKDADATKDVRLKNQRFEEAIAQLKIAASIYPLYGDAYINFGVTYSRLGKLVEAGAALEKAKSIRPGARGVQANLLYLSQLYLEEGVKTVQQNPDKAQEYFEKSAYYNPSNAQALYNLGGILFVKGDTAKARDYWKKTLQVDPSHSEATAWLAKTQNN
jgi:protein O-mannosyl-transferase